MSKEISVIGDQEARFVLGNIDDAYLGAWVPAKVELLHEALRPHVQDVQGVPSVPAKLLFRANKALNNTAQNKSRRH